MKKIILTFAIVASFISLSAQSNVDIFSKPQFPGGFEALNQFFDNNLKYPELAKKKGQEGTVILEYFISKDGKIDGEINILKSAGKELNEEAIRIAKSMPIWKPAKRNGKVIRIKYQLPIKFQLF